MVNIDDYKDVKECVYKDEHYSARDNGAVMRYPREGKRVRKDDNVWTFGKPNDKTGYMEIAGQRVHRIVAYAFLGNPPTDQHVVDHIDTNRRNNRPENLRWVTRLENILLNDITRSKIEYICGSVEAFLKNPSLLRNHELDDRNFSWMHTVSKEESENTLKWWEQLKENPRPKAGTSGLGEWIYQKQYTRKSNGLSNRKVNNVFEESVGISKSEQKNYESLTPNVIQINWKTPTEFPCCPKESDGNPLESYHKNLKEGVVFCKSKYFTTIVLDSAIADEGKSLYVITRSKDEAVKPWALAKITCENGIYFHKSEGTFFEEQGARKYFTLAQGKEWTGGDVFDDYC